MNTPKADEYLTVAEIARELKLNQQTIRNMDPERKLRAVYAGPRRVRILRSDLDRLLAGGATAPSADEQTTADPLHEIRRRLDPALHRARDALPRTAKATSPPP